MASLILLILTRVFAGGFAPPEDAAASQPGVERRAELQREPAPPDPGPRGITPCGGADLDRDGELDFIDVIIFLQLFSASQPVADLDANGAYDYLDVIVFLQMFSAGC